ncbi:hypothetical protein ALO41_200153 [Pseudomonas amygdali pv. ulmi]|uniref:Uncharacterized protein n=1 Tax=Pseudomonas amygdali pv. ulmi TaxID=251720 RepID=A0A0Q0DVW5_PSEA0|nr:hypothetical protein ALO41_200153 [Pseudomonas amygdali pv. ulmi]
MSAYEPCSLGGTPSQSPRWLLTVISSALDEMAIDTRNLLQTLSALNLGRCAQISCWSPCPFQTRSCHYVLGEAQATEVRGLLNLRVALVL